MTPVEIGRRRKRLQRAAMWIRGLVALAGAGLAIWAGWITLTRAGGAVRSLAYDIPFLFHRAGTPDDIRILYVDQRDGASLDRTIQPGLLDRLTSDGARAVIYDVMFLEPHPDPAVDLAFAESMRRFRGVDPDDKPVPGAPRRHIFLASGVEKSNDGLAEVEQVVPPTPALRRAADGSGPINFTDMLTIREFATGTSEFPGLTWKAASALGAELQDSDRLHPRWINYAGPPAASGLLADSPAILSLDSTRALEGAVPGFFRDKIVVVGGKPGIFGSQPGTDLFSTPFHTFDTGGDLPMMSGVEIHANMLANLLRQEWLEKSGPRADTWLVVASGLVFGILFALVRPLPAFLVAVLSLLAWTAAGIASVRFHQLWFPWTVPAFVQVPVALAWGVAANYQIQRFVLRKIEREWQHLQETFSRYLSPQMLAKLEEREFQVDLGGDVARVALMFTDLEGFSAMSERVRDPKVILQTLNEYFERTTGDIFDHDGIIIQFIGDCIFAAWGTPLPDEDAPIKAVRAAWKVFEKDKFVVEGVHHKTRFGLHYDEVVAGNIGTMRHLDFALVGDAVNLASRLEGLNSMLGTNILMSGEVRACIGDEFRTRRVGNFRVKGRDTPVAVHELLGPVALQSEAPWQKRYAEALTALESGDPGQARLHLEAVLRERRDREDGPSKFLLQYLSDGGVLGDGTISLTRKTSDGEGA